MVERLRVIGGGGAEPKKRLVDLPKIFVSPLDGAAKNITVATNGVAELQ